MKINDDGTYNVVPEYLNFRSYDDYDKKLPISKENDILTPISNDEYTRNLDGFDQDSEGFVLGKESLSLARIADKDGSDEIIAYIGLKPENHDYIKKSDLYRLKKASNSGFAWDDPLPGTAGSNIRERLNKNKDEQNNVLTVLPKGTQVTFEDEDHFYKASTHAKFFQLAKKDFGDDAWIFGTEVDSTPHIPQKFETVVTEFKLKKT